MGLFQSIEIWNPLEKALLFCMVSIESCNPHSKNQQFGQDYLKPICVSLQDSQILENLSKT